ncbi:MAG: SEC-C metal-binding domain-containing protein [Patescibacteria group bacterium]|nr:SEC-C metal-binding domain-containing protein [Patescibacteria group bacterium]
MTRIEQTQDELQKQLNEQLELLSKLADLYDNGMDVAAKSMATTIRVLLHDKGSSKSLLGQLGLKSKEFFDTSFDYNTNEIGESCIRTDGFAGLIGIPFGAGINKYLPYLDETKPGETKFVSFEDFWGKEIFLDKEKNSFSRKDIVLYVAEQDGGAHVDPGLDEKYNKLSRGNSLGWHTSSDGKNWESMKGAELVAIRQIGHEILRTFLPNYPHKKPFQGNGFMIAGAGMIIKTSSSSDFKETKNKVGRNQQCPCGSDKKYKKCCGF